jgi:PAS domain-containing protein
MRPNPTYELGVVDDRAALVVCDNEVHDAPIIYATESFEMLTGYYGSEIIGKNCRFLQKASSPNSPPWDVIQRCKKYNEPLLSELRHRIQRKEEAQVKIVNYHKDGTPFMNILTTIPIRYKDNDGLERNYIVGFQVNEKDITPSLG